MAVATDSSLEARIDGLAEAAASAGLDALLLTSDASIAYVTGFRPLQLERFFGVLVRASGDGLLVVPRLDEGQVAAAPARLERLVYDAGTTGLPELERALEGRGRIGVEEDHLILGRGRALAAAGLDLVAADDVVMGRRARKDEAEVGRIRAACGAVSEALGRLFEDLRPGAVERVVNARVEGQLREQGATESHPLILFGENAANPHAQPGERELRPGDVVCFPAGPRGAHVVANRGVEPARVLIASTLLTPSISVYPDSDKVGARPGVPQDTLNFRRSDAVDYWEGE